MIDGQNYLHHQEEIRQSKYGQNFLKTINMQIVRRKGISPFTTMNLWLIPTLTYVLQKSVGAIRPDREWIWFVGLPIVFSIWVLINFKFQKNK